jgi:hypothetical protein
MEITRNFDGPISPRNPLSVAQTGGAVTSVSGSITAGGTAQVLAAANASRRGVTLQNTSSGDLRVSPWGTASVSAGYKVASGDLLVLDSPHCGVGAISVWGATTGQTFVGGEAV